MYIIDEKDKLKTIVHIIPAMIENKMGGNTLFHGGFIESYIPTILLIKSN